MKTLFNVFLKEKNKYYFFKNFFFVYLLLWEKVKEINY
jgi:hypothetical protein